MGFATVAEKFFIGTITLVGALLLIGGAFHSEQKKKEINVPVVIERTLSSPQSPSTSRKDLVPISMLRDATRSASVQSRELMLRRADKFTYVQSREFPALTASPGREEYQKDIAIYRRRFIETVGIVVEAAITSRYSGSKAALPENNFDDIFQKLEELKRRHSEHLDEFFADRLKKLQESPSFTTLKTKEIEGMIGKLEDPQNSINGLKPALLKRWDSLCKYYDRVVAQSIKQLVEYFGDADDADDWDESCSEEPSPFVWFCNQFDNKIEIIVKAPGKHETFFFELWGIFLEVSGLHKYEVGFKLCHEMYLLEKELAKQADLMYETLRQFNLADEHFLELEDKLKGALDS